jgi:rhomboid family GlyGly-CTERM serine protease
MMLLRRLRLPLGLTLLVTLTALGGSELTAVLRFDSADIWQGELWRLFSGHLVHLGWSHWALNVAGLVLIWALVGEYFKEWQWLLILAGLALLISLGLLVFNPALGWYVGLSGVLHGLLTVGAIAQVRCAHSSGYLLLILVAAKLFWEQWAGPLPGSEISTGGTVIVDAHLYGGLSGLLFGALLKPRCQKNSAP